MRVVDKDFYSQFNDLYRLTTILVIYRLPDYQSILKEFVWQTLDYPPEYPRMFQFIEHWRLNIEAPIHSVTIENTEVISQGNFEFVDRYYDLK
jgi:uncharacterized protein Usg